MKNLLSLVTPVFIFTFLIFIQTSKATAQVSPEKAAIIAKNHYWKYTSKKIPYCEIDPVLAQIKKEGDFINYYAFNINDNQGFVVVSGDESKNPVIAYSFKGSFTIPDENAPSEFVNILNHNSRKTDELKSANVQNKIAWEELSQKNFIPEKEYKTSSVEPLIQSTWGQGEFYNDSVPEFNGQHMQVGCVATAMAQVMKYFNYPPKGSGENFYRNPQFNYNARANFGQTEYNWGNIPNSLTEPNSSVAQLNYHAAVSVNMNFDPIASGSSDEKAQLALIKYFNYPSNINRIYTDYFESIGNNWKDSLINELDNNRPVIFSGTTDTGYGHAFICDGYQDDYFHFNFGWYGSGDGYFYLSDVNSFNNRKSILTNIKAPVVGFAVDKLNPSLNDTVKIEILTKEETENIQWSFYPDNVEFVNGTNEHSENPEIILKEPGQYSVFLNVEVNGKSINFIKNNYIDAGFTKIEQFNNDYGIACHQSLPVKWFDYDNDGDLDLIQSLLLPLTTYLYENVNGNFLRKSQNFPSSYDGSIATFDYNNDGFKDIFIMGGSGPIKLFKNIDGKDFIEEETTIPQLSEGTIIPGDYNNDGWTDLFVAGKKYNISTTTFYYHVIRNEEGNFTTVFSDSVTVDALYRNDNIADFADFDNDGDLDIALHEVTDEIANSGIRILYNTKDGFVKSDYLISGTGDGALNCVDFDNDGDVDIISATNTGISILKNDNNSFSAEPFLLKTSFWQRIELNDFNYDGKIDILLSILWSEIYLSNSEGAYETNNPLKINAMDIGIDTHLGDYNNDGYIDIAKGNEIFKNYEGSITNPENKAPNAPAGLKHFLNNNNVTLSWERSEDRETPNKALTYNIMLGTSAGKMDVINPQSDIITGKRKIVKMGNVYLNNNWTIKNLNPGKYYWSVQAIDNSYEGGLFARIDSFEIPGNPSVHQISYETLCEGDSVFWRGNFYKTEGQYVEKSTNAVIDTIFELNLAYSQVYFAEEITICEGDSVFWEGKYYKTEGVYEKNFLSENSCDSIKQLNLFIYKPDTTFAYQTICEGESYLGFTESGTYFLKGANYYNCNSINQLELTVNPRFEIDEEIWLCENEKYNGWTLPGNYTRELISSTGCDSIVHTSLNFYDPITFTYENVSICQGKDYMGWTEPGIYDTTFVNVNGCDSLVCIGLSLTYESETWETKTICQGEEFMGWDKSGEYTYSLESTSGCDSIIHCYLTVQEPIFVEEFITLCVGGKYLGHTESETFERTLVSVAGCDSIVTTYLIVLPLLETIDSVTICAAETYKGWSTEGEHIENLTSVNGCDSTVFTWLTILNPFFEEHISICDGESYLGHTESTTFVRYLTSSFGCDSILTTYLTVLPPIETNETVTICPGETYKGWNTEGEHTVTFTSTSGCDSTVITNLTFYPTFQPEIVVLGDTITSVGTYLAYQWFDESGAISGATDASYIILKSGDYWLQVTDENGCMQTSEAVSLIHSEITNQIINGFSYSIIPNPNNGQFRFQIESNPPANLNLTLINSLGQTLTKNIIQNPATGEQINFNVNRANKGIYFLLIQSGEILKSEKIVIH